MTNESIISKARGALRLSREGTTAGERAAAQAALDRILARHGLDVADLETPDLDWYEFGYGTFYEQRLLLQLHNMITAGRETQYLEGNTYVEIRMTPVEFEELTRVYDAYLTAWRETMDDLWKAFVLKNRLYSSSKETATAPSDEALLLAWTLDRVPVPLAHGRRIRP